MSCCEVGGDGDKGDTQILCPKRPEETPQIPMSLSTANQFLPDPDSVEIAKKLAFVECDRPPFQLVELSRGESIHRPGSCRAARQNVKINSKSL